MNKYEKAKMLSMIDDDLLIEKKENSKGKPFLARYALSLSFVICLITVCLFSMPSLSKKQNTIFYIDRNRIMSDEIIRIENYYDTTDTVSYLRLNNDIVEFYENDNLISTFSSTSYKEAMDIFNKFHLKKLNMIYVNETTYVMKGEKHNTQYFIPFYTNRHLPKEYTLIDNYRQLPDLSDFVYATKESINNSADISFGSPSFVLMPKQY